jgi:DNA-binding response OmpR family regulator
MKILVIDDDPFVRYSVSNVLRTGGHDVLEAADGERGLVVFRNERPDLVITDLMMPEKDGVATIVSLRQVCRKTKIMAFSGSDGTFNADGLARALEAGADEVVVKPVDWDDLLHRVEQCDPHRSISSAPLAVSSLAS